MAESIDVIKALDVDFDALVSGHKTCRVLTSVLRKLMTLRCAQDEMRNQHCALPCAALVPRNELFPVEHARVIQLLVDRVDVAPDGADIRLRTEGLTKLVSDLGAIKPQARRAA